MSKINPVSYKRLEAIFLKKGFSFRKTSGDHDIFVKKGIVRPIVIPRYKEIPVFVIKNLLRTSGISREEYFDLLKNC